ncbi:NACHT domain-containing protein [Thalassomonas actiniarum]|uniref:NACHT domain-containing protein n=1 Tax=Thalassomonas actiniarum TaxID=485447 RepID=A0AAE9YSE8_9GAMM|nr:NACHT domain-containing protein [Thalassomonas actiniarum]WDD99434.1 NACHT domain-containing protein [Thalassomonas actiniarum]
MAKHPLRLLDPTNNGRGDLFTRLVSDLFYALGYDNLRFDVHKTGREIDIEGRHRHESRLVIAECKAHAKPIGGADLNKILGAVTREREKGQPVAGYFVSLGGFTESAIEQERGSSEQTRIIPIDTKGVITELTRSNIIITQEKAVERAGRCAEHARLDSQAQFNSSELLGHPLGYIWALYYELGKDVTHFALVHADGNPLSETAAAQVIEADRKCKGSLHKLTYLAPPPASPDRKTLTAEALEHYKNWLNKVCGYIQLDGLPAEGTIASKQMTLENLFVPLKLQVQSNAQEDDESTQEPEAKIHPVGEFITNQNRFSILAKPGGGKSTLLKRLAVAYADPDRRSCSEDGLPERDWLPLLLRCRDLRERTREPIRELLCDLGRHTEMDDNYAAAFRELVDDALNSGRALLLVDGLDEFSDAAARTTFANNLRVFLGMYPHTALVVTSREAGFRQVAGVIASVCVPTTMASFDKNDVHTLCKRWHAEVLPDTGENREEAIKLAKTIWSNKRIRALAENPLMLTTLLVVKRNVGELPTKRVKLYAAAINVLIRTWNVEGFAPLNEEETLARLSYIAVAMMRQGKQRIGKRQLLKLLQQAQKELEAELAYADIKPNKFIERVEYRSSLLMQTGYEDIDGVLEEVYEFRHLTFQEYLAARGLVEEQYPGRDDAAELSDLLEPYFKDESWREVVPLSAVLANRKSERLIQRLTEICATKELKHSLSDMTESHVALLRKCVLDEIQVRESTLRDALRQLARYASEEMLPGSTIHIIRGKFGRVFQEVAEDAFFGQSEDWVNYQSVIMDLGIEQFFGDRHFQMSAQAAAKLEHALTNGDPIQQGKAANTIAWSAFQAHNNGDKDFATLTERFRPLRYRIEGLLGEEENPLTLSMAVAMIWMGIAGLTDNPPDKEAMLTLFRLWQNAQNHEVRRIAKWAFGMQPLLPRDAIDVAVWGDCETLINNKTQFNEEEECGSLVLAWYRGQPWSDAHLLEKLKEILSDKKNTIWVNRFPALFHLLNALGEPGRQALAEWKQNAKTEILNKLGSNIRRVLELED